VIDHSDDGFNLFDGYERALDPEAVDVRVKAPLRNRPDELDNALRTLDAEARDAAPAGRLAEMLDPYSYAEYSEWVFALDVPNDSSRLRQAVARGWRTAWQFATKFADLVDKDEATRDLLSHGRKIAALHKAIVAAVDDPIVGTELQALMLPYLRRLEIVVRGARPASYGNTVAVQLLLRRTDILADAEFDAETEREVAEVEALLEVDLESQSFVINEERAAAFWDQEAVARLRNALRWELPPFDLRGVNPIDFFVLRLAEIYAFTLGRKVPTYFDRSAKRGDDGPDKRFVSFVSAAFTVCKLPIPSWDLILRSWKSLPGVRGRLDALEALSLAARRQDAPPFLLDTHRHLATVEILHRARIPLDLK
jgi:hypothetical protein